VRERRALRFLVEALFLGALAAALVVADLDPLWIAGVMLLGWIVVAFYEWAATRELPHYGRGLPPRYYVPQIALPPPRQLEQLRSGYPAAGPDDQATWIATPAMRAEALADWPVNPASGPLPPPGPGEDTMVVDSVLFVGEEEFHQDTWIELDPIAEGKGRDGDAVPVAVVEEVVEPEAVEEPEAVATEAAVEPEPALMEEPPPLAPDEPEVVAAVVEEAEEGVLDDLEPVALAAAAAESEAVETHDAADGNGVDPVLAAAAAVVAEPESEAGVAEPEADAVEPMPEADESFDVVVASAAAAAVVVEPDEIAEAEPEHDRAVEAVIAVAAASVLAADSERGAEADSEPDLEPVIAAAVGAVAEDPDALAEPEPEDDTEESAVAAPVAPVPDRPARHTFDPLADDAPTRRRWRRRDDPWVEVPSRPPKPLALPGAARREP